MKYSIAVFGAFNVRSFGDSLFPEAIHAELSKHIEIGTFAVFSLGGRKAPFTSREVYDYSKFENMHQEKKFDVILIGGGELLHNQTISFPEDGVEYPAGAVWKIPAEYGRKYGIPVILNAVGMPYEFEEKDRPELERLVSGISYVALRDIYSYQRWVNFFGASERVCCVPDSLWNIKDYFDGDLLQTRLAALKEKYRLNKPYLVFQYGTTAYFREAEHIAEQFAQNEDLQIAVIAINAAHEDLYVVQHTAENERLTVISDELAPEEIAALISGSRMFVGTSLHGNLTAMAYGVKNIIVDMYPEFVSKMDGFAEMQDTDRNFVGETDDLWTVLNREYASERYYLAGKIAELRRRVTEHYERICSVIGAEERPAESLVSASAGTGAVVSFKKIYFRFYSKDGLCTIKKRIVGRKNGCYEIRMETPFEEKILSVKMAIPLGSPARVTSESEEELLLGKNDVREDIYIGPALCWDLKVQAKYEFSIQITDVISSEIAEDILKAYKNETMHAGQLIFKERDYHKIIEQAETQAKEAEDRIEDYESRLQTKEQQITELKAESESRLQTKEQQIKELKAESERRLQTREQETESLRQEIVELKQEVLNKEGHIQLLLPPEREYKKIINSKMYKVMRFVCRTYDIVMIVPRFVGRNVYAFCRMMTHVNPQELKIAYGYVKNEGIPGAYRHLMRDYHQGEIRQIPVEVEKKIYDEITDLAVCPKITLPKAEKPLVSIVIPAYNQFTYTYYCLKSILENSGDISYEVILADDCSNDLTTRILEVVENLVVMETEHNLLFLRNCNNAAKAAKGDYILLLNNDTQVQKDWLRPLVELCEKDGTIGMVGSKLVYADGTLQEAGGIIWKDGSGWNYGRNDDAAKPEYNYVRDVDYISGAAIMIRTELWKQLGGFDEHFAPAYCEDSDLAFMVRQAGYRVVYQPKSVVVHFEGKSNGTDLNSGVKKYQVENSLKLREKWKTEFEKQYENAQCVFKARERSKDKKVILVIDHYVPQFDKDAGSKTTFQYLEMFIRQGYSVKFIGDNFYQHEPYTTVLQQMGVEVLYGPWYAQHWQEWILDNRNYIDFAYLNRPHITIKYIDFLREKTNIKCIYYGHDLHFLRLRREYELTGNEEKLAESREWLEKELYIMKRADISYYPSCVEEEEIHKIDPSISVKAITAYVYEQFLDKIEMDFTKREGIIFVGGFGHPPNEDAVLWFAKEIYPLVAKKLDVPFYIIGSKPTDAVMRLNQGKIIVKGFVSEEELARLYGSCRLVVVPLRYGAGVKGKVVEALYYGSPMVTTSVGAEGIKDAETFIEIADTSRKFADSVISLYTDEKRLAETAEAYQNYVKENFSIDAVWNIIKEDFK